MKSHVVRLWLLVVCFPPACLTAQDPQIRPLAASVAQFSRIEFDITVGSQEAAPDGSAEMELNIVFNTAGDRAVRVPAFRLQPYERRELTRSGRPVLWLYPDGPPRWRARFAPAEIGSYTAVAEVTDRDGTRRSGPVDFTCTPSASRGFVRVSRSDPRYFEFSTGQPFFPIGQNLAFIGDSQYVTPAQVMPTFERLSRHGANYLRIWTCCHDWALAIEACKSAWGRSWNWDPPFDSLPDEGESERKFVHLNTGQRPAQEVSPSHAVALRPRTPYVLSGRARLEPSAQLQVRVGARALADRVTSSGGNGWQRFALPFTTNEAEYWLDRTELRVTGQGSAWIDALSLREAAGGPELLWEAAVNRAERGYYNPVDSAQLDHIVEAAEQCGIYLQLCLITRDAYIGDLKDDQSEEYVQAIRDAQNLLRYAVARWGYSTHVATWEYFNENDPGLPMERFHREVGEYLQRIDPYGHLRSTSTWHPSARDCRHSQLDVADVHFYLRPVENRPYADEVEAAVGNAKWLREHAPAKPALIGEFGLADPQWRETREMRESREVVDFHNAIWASALSDASGTALFWWWDRLDARNHYPDYRPLADFLANVPWTTAHLQPIAAITSGPRVRLVGLQGADRAYFWLFDPRASWDSVVIGAHQPERIEGVHVELAHLKPGTYRAEWWDTRAGGITQQEDLQLTEPPLRLTAPSWQRDVACKIVPAG